MIPMNQREYSWETKEISRFLDDIFKLFEEGKYVEKMGSIINLKYNDRNDIYDGQQRILTIIISLKVIGCFSEKLKNKINQLLTVDTDLDNLTPEQTKIKDECGVSIIPKMFCINPHDMMGLVNIFNNKVKSWICYLKNIDDVRSLDDLDNLDKYVSESYVKGFDRKADFIRHLNTKYSYKEPDNSTKLHSAFIEIYNHFALKKYDEPKLIELYKFILNDIDIQFFECTDPEYVSRIFDWENNRGKSVEYLDIIKNPILVQIPNDKKVYIYKIWESLKHKKNKIYKKNFGQKIFDIAIQLYNNTIKRKIIHEEEFKHIINSEDTYKEILKFFKIVNKLFDIMDQISDDKFGRLLNNTSRICLNWEAYMWCLLPIFYKTDNIDSNMIKLMAKWYFRRIGLKLRGFNNLGYSNEFIEITNKVLNDKKYNYYEDIEKCLVKHKDESVSDENYLRSMTSMNFKSTNATHLLLFLETCINTDTHIVPLDYTLEHIYCQKNKEKLTDISLMDNIGNLTLIEGKNSVNGHKGNSSLGSKPYDKKIQSYKGSGSKITRDISEEFESFSEVEIRTRNSTIASLLNKFTKY